MTHYDKFLPPDIDNLPVLEQVRARRDACKASLNEMRNAKSVVTASESRSLEPAITDGEEMLKRFETRISELEEIEVRNAAANAHHVEVGTAKVENRAYATDPEVYRDPHKDSTSPSFFRDLADAKRGNWAAAERLTRNHKAAVDRETRAGDMTTVAGAGGQFAPPLWLVEEFVALARAGRVTADLLQHDVLPSGVSSVNLPKVSTGATTAVQVTQNSALSDTAMTTTSVSSGITTIGGRQIVSLQLLNQSGIPFDRVILGDLAADYAKQLDNQVLYGTNANGQLNGLVNVAVNTAFTTASPALTSSTAANSYYNKVIAAAAGIATTRYLAATAVVMHPNRWAWALEALDSQVRPIISADGQSVNTAAISTDVVAQGSVGTLAKLPVFVDANVSVTANSSTNQDETYVLRSSDIYLWESPLRLESFDSPYADNASVLFRCLAWSAMISNRYSGSVGSIRGTGCVVPVL